MHHLLLVTWGGCFLIPAILMRQAELQEDWHILRGYYLVLAGIGCALFTVGMIGFLCDWWVYL